MTDFELIQCQGKLKRSRSYQNFAFCKEIRIMEANASAKILTGSSQIAILHKHVKT